MRFLMLNWRDPENPLSGGAERVTLGYWSALAARGHEAWWFAFAFPGAAPRAQIEGVEIIRRGGKGSAIWEAWRWARRQPPFDLVVDQIHGIPWYAPWWSGTRCLAYVHEVLGPIWDAFYQSPWNWIGRTQELWQYWLYRNVPFWTASESTRRDLFACGVKNVTLIPYGVHTRALPALEEKQLRAPLRLAMVSRLAPNKRIDHGIQAVQALRKRGLAATLTVIGEGEIEPLLRAQARALGLAEAVRFAGPLPERAKDECLRQSHLLLHTSQREGWGLNVIEANAMGTPAAVYPVPGLIESTLHGETGRVAAREDPDALADEIEWLWNHPDAYQLCRQQAWRRAETFHWSRVSPAACDRLEDQAGRPPAQRRK